MQGNFQMIMYDHESKLAYNKKVSNRLGYAKLVSVLALAIFIIFLFTSNFAMPVVFGIIFVFATTATLWVWHIRVEEKVQYSSGICQICRNHLARISGEWATFADIGQELASFNHPYAHDLDIVGAKSLFQFLNTTHTWHGRQAFSHDLLYARYTSQEIRERQSAINELSQDIEFANDVQFFFSQIQKKSQKTKPDATFEEKLVQELPFIKSQALKIFILCMPVAATLLLLGGLIFQVSPVFTAGVVCVVIQHIVLTISRAKPREYLGIMHRMPYSLNKYAPVMKMISDRQFSSQTLCGLRQTVKEGQGAIKELDSISTKLSVVANPVIYFLLNLCLLWDCYCAFLLERWRDKHAKNIATWFNAIGQFESLLAFSHLPNVCSNTTIPNILDTAKDLDATALGHPLLQNSTRICNNIRMNNNIFIVSGSNMSGKTTFMRTVGINLILARAGSFVCAGQFSCSLFDVITSMRIVDDLNQGVSTFYAELKRVKQILDTAKTNPNTFFLIDEIFKGTNSIDRIAGAETVIATLEKLESAGMVSTHDLELCRLADLHRRILNFSFSENYVEGKILFSYKINEGKSQTTNAKFLMQMVGITHENHG